MLGRLLKNEKAALAILKQCKEMGYEAIELNGFMIEPNPWVVKSLASFANMPVGNSDRLNRHQLIQRSGLEVCALHYDLGSLIKKTDEAMKLAESYHCRNPAITAAYGYDYSRISVIESICQQLNDLANTLKSQGFNLFYHNHNVEFTTMENGETVYDYLLQHTNENVLFELDIYWAAEAGVDLIALIRKLGKRLKLIHLNDRGLKIK